MCLLLQVLSKLMKASIAIQELSVCDREGRRFVAHWFQNDSGLPKMVKSGVSKLRSTMFMAQWQSGDGQ